MDPAQFKSRINQIFKDLDSYNYYELLNLTPDANGEEVQNAFHRMAISLHPDRHNTSQDLVLKSKVHTIYKRIAEGYRVLIKPDSRQEYDAGLAEGQLRLVKTERKKSGPENPEDSITHPQAKKFFIMGLEAEREGNLKNARLNYKFASDLIGEHAEIKSRMEWIDSMLGNKK